MNPILVFIDCQDKVEAEDIGRALLKKRLVACVNILTNPVYSLYFWHRHIEDANEIIILAKTFDEKWNEIEKQYQKFIPMILQEFLLFPSPMSPKNILRG
ncbi:MAG: hypothetical protein ACD_48C00257G0006 [uncultured bacterium]|nr:MAG: hypothetical protein ACD_48C00257G0006 [uncultured bacterium]